MKVNLNNLRKQTAYALDSVIKILNSGIKKEDNNDGIFISETEIKVYASDLEKPIEELRNLVWSLLCCYEDGNDNFSCVWEDVEKSGGIAEFNPEND